MSNTDKKDFRELQLLITEALDGAITSEGLERLENILKDDPASRRYYTEYLDTHTGLRYLFTFTQSLNSPALGEDFDELLWQELAESERKAKTIKIEKPKEAPQITSIEKAQVAKQVRSINKFMLFTAITSIAALLLVLAYVHMNPRPVIEEVATLVDTFNVQWSENSKSIGIGDRFWSNEESRWLQRGIVVIAFDYGAEIIIEAPAEFRLKAADEITLQSGRLYAKVPKHAIGFTVNTPSSSVIDLGTEFGMKVDVDGATDIHMLKGKASMTKGPKGQTEESQMLTSGQAKRIKTTGQVEDIELSEKSFVRAIDSKNQLVWRGERELDLADIVSGGNGLGTNRRAGSIHPVTGSADLGITPRGEALSKGLVGNNTYNIVNELPFVDGVFVPQHDGEPPLVSSMGHIFEGCPQTSNRFWIEIFNSSRREITSNYTSYWNPIKLNGELFDTPANPSILMVANVGITFDLENIRLALSGVSIRRFQALCGLNEQIQQAEIDLWILVDGQVRYGRQHIKNVDNAEEVIVELNDNDRFLTLIVSDSDGTIAHDWGVIGRPVLILE